MVGPALALHSEMYTASVLNDGKNCEEDDRELMILLVYFIGKQNKQNRLSNEGSISINTLPDWVY